MCICDKLTSHLFIRFDWARFSLFNSAIFKIQNNDIWNCSFAMGWSETVLAYAIGLTILGMRNLSGSLSAKAGKKLWANFIILAYYEQAVWGMWKPYTGFYWDYFSNWLDVVFLLDCLFVVFAPKCHDWTKLVHPIFGGFSEWFQILFLRSFYSKAFSSISYKVISSVSCIGRW